MNSPRSEDQQARRPPEFLDVGRIVRPHGLKGELVLEPFSELVHILEPSTEIQLGSEHNPVIVSAIRPHHSRYLLSIEGCEDRNAAEMLRGEVVRIRFEQAKPLQEGVYYHWQILDLPVFTSEGDFLGTIVEILETGANDIYMVKDERGEEILLPAIKDVILKVDLESAKIIVDVPTGLLPEE
ncbi:MAG: 16S rRNA processing protein RimM [Anaerolineaceae bacterium]|nr:MAG: 16S rRNA processing protein RimM [Anaerolineaceae bacterium]